MIKKIIFVSSLFVSSLFVGFNLVPTKVIAQNNLVVPSKEIPKLQISNFQTKPIQDVNVTIDLATNNVSVTGVENARINVTTINQPTPVVKEVIRYRKQIEYVNLNNSRPETNVMNNYIKNIMVPPKLNLVEDKCQLVKSYA